MHIGRILYPYKSNAHLRFLDFDYSYCQEQNRNKLQCNLFSCFWNFLAIKKIRMQIVLAELELFLESF